jgi:hypothetical protein
LPCLALPCLARPAGRYLVAEDRSAAGGRDQTGRKPPVHGGYTRSRQAAECNGHERSQAVARSRRSSRQHSDDLVVLQKAGREFESPHLHQQGLVTDQALCLAQRQPARRRYTLGTQQPSRAAGPGGRPGGPAPPRTGGRRAPGAVPQRDRGQLAGRHLVGHWRNDSDARYFGAVQLAALPGENVLVGRYTGYASDIEVSRGRWTWVRLEPASLDSVDLGRVTLRDPEDLAELLDAHSQPYSPPLPLTAIVEEPET